MEKTFLTVKEAADLKGCTERNIRALISRKVINAQEVEGLNAGQGGIQYRIPLDAFDIKLQMKYKRLLKKKEKSTEIPAEEIEVIDLEDLSASEREEISYWKSLLLEWRTYRNKAELNKAEADTSFIQICNIKNPELNLTRRTLYRKWKDYNEQGEGALIDRRGKHGNHSRKLLREVWDIFESFYLDESQKSINLCVTLTKLEIKKSELPYLPLPAVSTFAKEVNKIPTPYIEYFRHGDMNFIGKCSPYIKRMYENLEPNDIWVADNHTFDVMLYDGQKTLRLYLTAFMDVRTRKMMGWCVTDRPCSDATIFALRKGIEKYGIPKMLYTDNGREFLFHDFGGNGFRKKKITPEEFKPPTILAHLGIEFRTALPRNARAKGIERAFYTVKETFSKLFEAYTGGNVVEKPDRLKYVVKDVDRLKTVEEFIGFVDTYLAGWYNKQPHRGEGMNGLSPDEVFAKLLIEKRCATIDTLNLMFMRWSRPLRVGKNGVTLTFYDKKLQYFEQDLWVNYFGKDVYVRYTPDDLSKVRIYDIEEKFICEAALKNELGYDATKEAISENMKEVRAAGRAVRDYKKLKNIQTHDELELILDQAAENLAEGENIRPTLLKPLFNTEIKKAVGSELNEVIDWTAALNNLKK